MSVAYEITELHRRLSNLLNIGAVEETKYSGEIPLVMVCIGELLTAWLPLVSFACWP